MSQVNLSAELYKLAERRAAEAGFQNVDEYVEDIVSQDLLDEDEDMDGFFTPERVAMLERISLEIEAGGKTYSLEEVREHFAKKSAQWQKEHAL